jgi:hypothetical protein
VPSGSGKDGDQLVDYLRAARVGRHRAVAGGGLEPGMELLRTWQAKRLARTHADLLASARYGPAGRFFLSDVYAARDFSQRDHDLERVYNSMRLVLPPAMGRALELVIGLNDLTLDLDEALLRVLVDELGMTDTLTAEIYAEAYRRCDNYEDRARQIDLVTAVGREIDGLVRRPAVGLALRLARVPARLAGWHELQDFFERGFDAFRRMKGAEEFLRTISDRERRILDRIFAGAPDPFEPS